MASPVDVIYKVNEFLYSRQTPMTFRECQNCLVDRHILSEQEADHHHKEIRSRYLEWKTGFEARHGGNQQPQPAGPPTPESPAPHAAPSNISPSSPPGGARGATILHGLKEALERIDPEVWPLTGPGATTLFLPGDRNHLSKQVNRKETLAAQSYIQARTLEKHGLGSDRRTINLQWQSRPVTPGRDECVQDTCFVVVDETLAKEAGFSFDMLVGADHGRPLRDQIQALGAEDISSASSSIADQTEDLPARSLEMSRSSELHHISDVYHRPPPTVQLSLSGTPDQVAILLKGLGASGNGMSRAMNHPAEHLSASPHCGCGRLK